LLLASTETMAAPVNLPTAASRDAQHARVERGTRDGQPVADIVSAVPGGATSKAVRVRTRNREASCGQGMTMPGDGRMAPSFAGFVPVLLHRPVHAHCGKRRTRRDPRRRGAAQFLANPDDSRATASFRGIFPSLSTGPSTRAVEKPDGRTPPRGFR